MNFEQQVKFPRAQALGIAFALLVCAGIAAFSLWYVSSGRFPVFPHIQNDYVDLGEAFLGAHGADIDCAAMHANADRRPRAIRVGVSKPFTMKEPNAARSNRAPIARGTLKFRSR